MNLTDYQQRAQTDRLEVVMAAQSLIAEGRSLRKTARLLKVNAGRLSEWLRAFADFGEAGLIPNSTNSGRRPLATLSEIDKRAVQQLALQSDPHDPTKTRKFGVSFALRTYARSEACPPALADVILKARSSKHTITPTLKRAARVTQSTRLKVSGPGAFDLHGICTPRDLTYVDADKQEKPIMPGLLFESDDMTSNEPCCVEWDDPADLCAARYGVRLVRPQCLPWLDVGSGRYVGYSVVLRYNDAYRAKDIKWAMSHVFHTVGAPQFLRFELGTWDANLINDVESVHKICKVLHATSAKTKYIENRFNQLQKYLALGGISMGRHRGVKEKESANWTACRMGQRDPRKLFPSLADWTARFDAALVAFNTEPVEGEIYGPANARRFHNRRAWVPDEIWHQHMDNNPLRKPTLEESYRLLPEQADVTIRGGHVKVKSAEHDAVFYFYSDAFARLGDGYQVTVCCDLAQPHLGAAIVNREQGARSAVNPEGAQTGRPYREGELICIAEAVDRVPQFSATGQYDDRASLDRRRRYREQCKLLYRAIMPFGRGQTMAPKALEQRDGRGAVEVGAINAGRLSSDSPVLDSRPSALDSPGVRPISPAIADRARRQGVQALVNEAAGRLTASDRAAATGDNGAIAEAPPDEFTPEEIAHLLSTS